MAKENETAQAQSDAELNAVIDQNKRKAARKKIVLVVGIVIAVIGLICFGTVSVMGGLLIFEVGVIITVIYGIAIAQAKRSIKDCMTESALVPALEAVFDHVEYRPKEHIDIETLLNTNMGFDFRINKIQGNDYVKAEYKGVSIEMSNIRLITENMSGSLNYTSDTINFQGLWLICDFHKRFSANLLLKERKGPFDGLAKSTVQTESESFNKQFVIQSDSDHDVFYILTPHMMEYIQEMDRKANGRTYMRFEKEGKLVLALDMGRDVFGVYGLKNASSESLREQFIGEVRYVTDLIDELRLVDTLHEKA